MKKMLGAIRVLLMGLMIVVLSSFAGCVVEAPARVVPAMLPMDSTKLIVSQQNVGLWVNGTGKTTATPDVAMLTLGVESQQKSVKQAQTEVANSMNGVMQTLNNYGIADKDIQTSGYNIQQVMVQETVVYDEPQLPPSVLEGAVSSSSVVFSPWIYNKTKEIIEYKVSNSINVKIRNIGKTGDIIDDIVSSGGDLIRINGVSFSVDDPTSYYKIAREKAILYAMEKAKQISQLSGSQLGKAIYISESNSYYVPPMVNYMKADMSGGGGGSTQISAGELEFQVNVEMVYEMK